MKPGSVQTPRQRRTARLRATLNCCALAQTQSSQVQTELGSILCPCRGCSRTCPPRCPLCCRSRTPPCPVLQRAVAHSTSPLCRHSPSLNHRFRRAAAPCRRRRVGTLRRGFALVRRRHSCCPPSCSNLHSPASLIRKDEQSVKEKWTVCGTTGHTFSTILQQRKSHSPWAACRAG